MKKALITGSAGLIGSEATKFFIEKKYQVIGIDNNMREYFFGKEASTKWNQILLQKQFKKKYIHNSVDIRDDNKIKNILKNMDLSILLFIQPHNLVMIGQQKNLLQIFLSTQPVL